MADEQNEETLAALARVSRAAEWLREAELERMVAVQSAHEAGAAVTSLAEAAGISRPTVYRLLHTERALPPQNQWREILRAGLEVLAARGSLDAMRVLSAPVQALEVLARRIEMSLRQVQPADFPERGSGDYESLVVARDVAREIERRIGAGVPLPG